MIIQIIIFVLSLSALLFLNNYIYLNYIRKKEHKQWVLLLGRYQVPIPHKGHRLLIDTLLSEGKHVLIGLRKEDGTDKNPYTIKQRKKAFKKLYRKEIKEGRVKVIGLEDITEIAYGRTPGWSIREIKVPEYIKSISATKIREQNKS